MTTTTLLVLTIVSGIVAISGMITTTLMTLNGRRMSDIVVGLIITSVGMISLCVIRVVVGVMVIHTL